MMEIDETVWTGTGQKSQRREMKGTGEGRKRNGTDVTGDEEDIRVA